METEEIERIKGDLKHFDTIIKSELSLYYLEGLKLFKMCRSLLSALETAQKEIANRAHFEREYRKQLESSQREAEGLRKALKGMVSQCVGVDENNDACGVTFTCWACRQANKVNALLAKTKGGKG